MADTEQPPFDAAAGGHTVVLTEKDVRDAARLFRLISAGTPWANILSTGAPIRSNAEPNDHNELIARARAVLNTRQLRARHFNRAMFAEPAWDILLMLYLADTSEARQSVGQLAELIETPPTTVLRWVSYLEKEHLIARTDHPTDRRVAFVGLTDQGRNALNGFFSEMPV